jgi:hypothetical protein
VEKLGGREGHVFDVFSTRTDRCCFVCGVKVRTCLGLKLGGNPWGGMVLGGTVENRWRSGVCLCVVCLLCSLFFRVVVLVQTLVCDVMCVESKVCVGLKIVVMSCLMLECGSPHVLVFYSAVYVCCLTSSLPPPPLPYPSTQEWKERNTDHIHPNLPSNSKQATWCMCTRAQHQAHRGKRPKRL